MSMRVVIIGAGGHAQVVADILMRMQDAGAPVQPLGYVDDNLEMHGLTQLGLLVLGGIAALPTIPHDALIIGIGANRIRREIYARLSSAGERFAIARHPAAVIAPDVSIGPGTVICAGAIVNPGAVVGANVILNTACSADHHNRIGDHAHIAPGVHMGGDVEVGSGALVGIGSIVMPQRRVGAWSIVGAGALVQTNVPDQAVVVGVPARPIRQAEQV